MSTEILLHFKQIPVTWSKGNSSKYIFLQQFLENVLKVFLWPYPKYWNWNPGFWRELRLNIRTSFDGYVLEAKTEDRKYGSQESGPGTVIIQRTPNPTPKFWILIVGPGIWDPYHRWQTIPKKIISIIIWY